MNQQVEKFYGVVPLGEDKGRISNIDLAQDMANANKPFEDAHITGGYLAVAELFVANGLVDSSDCSVPHERLQDIPGNRVYKKFLKQQQKWARIAIEDSMNWHAVNRPSSAGLPTLGKR